jgi:PhnB protein
MSVKPIPDGFHSVTPYLMVDDAQKFIDFLKKAFSAGLISRHDTDDGKIMHAEVKIGDRRRRDS